MLSKNQFKATAIIATIAIAMLLTLTLMQTNQSIQTGHETASQYIKLAEENQNTAALSKTEQNTKLALTKENQNTASPAPKEQNTTLTLTKQDQTTLTLSSENKKAAITFHSLENNELKPMPKEAQFSIDSTKLGETSHKWGYKFKLPSQDFVAAALVESEESITILDREKGELQLNFTRISFEDVLEYGYTIETTQLNSTSVQIKMLKDYKAEGIQQGDWVYIDPTATLITEIVSTESTSNASNSVIAVDDTNIYIVWEDLTNYGEAGTDQDIFFKTKLKTGNWGTHTQLVSTESTVSSYYPAIAVDDTNIYITWWDSTNYGGAGTDKDIFFKTKGKTDALANNDINWTGATEVVSTESTGNSINPVIAVSDSNIYITWWDITNYNGAGTDYDVFFKTRSKTGNWGTNTEVVSTESTGASYLPVIAVNDSNIYIAWHDPTNYGGAGTDQDIFFKTRGKTGNW